MLTDNEQICQDSVEVYGVNGCDPVAELKSSMQIAAALLCLAMKGRNAYPRPQDVFVV